MVPPDSLDPDQRMDLAILHVAHASVHFLTASEDEFCGPFLEEYFSLFKLPYKTCADFAEQGLHAKLRLRLPAHLQSKLDGKPQSTRCA